MKKIIFSLLLMVISFSPVYASNGNGVTTSCTANNTLLSQFSQIRCVNNVCSTIQFNSTDICQYGCATDEFPNHCNVSPFQSNLIIFSAMIIVIFLLVWVFFRFRGR